MRKSKRRKNKGTGNKRPKDVQGERASTAPAAKRTRPRVLEWLATHKEGIGLCGAIVGLVTTAWGFLAKQAWAAVAAGIVLDVAVYYACALVIVTAWTLLNRANVALRGVRSQSHSVPASRSGVRPSLSGLAQSFIAGERDRSKNLRRAWDLALVLMLPPVALILADRFWPKEPDWYQALPMIRAYRFLATVPPWSLADPTGVHLRYSELLYLRNQADDRAQALVHARIAAHRLGANQKTISRYASKLAFAGQNEEALHELARLMPLTISAYREAERIGRYVGKPFVDEDEIRPSTFYDFRAVLEQIRTKLAQALSEELVLRAYSRFPQDLDVAKAYHQQTWRSHPVESLSTARRLLSRLPDSNVMALPRVLAGESPYPTRLDLYDLAITCAIATNDSKSARSMIHEMVDKYGHFQYAHAIAAKSYMLLREPSLAFAHVNLGGMAATPSRAVQALKFLDYEGDSEQAVMYAEYFRDKFPDNAEVQEECAEAFVVHAAAYDDAEPCIERSVELSPHFDNLLLSSFVAAMRGYLPKAKVRLAAAEAVATEQDLGSTEYYSTKARILFGDETESGKQAYKEWVREMVLRFPDELSSWRHQRNVCDRAGDVVGELDALEHQHKALVGLRNPTALDRENLRLVEDRIRELKDRTKKAPEAKE